MKNMLFLVIRITALLSLSAITCFSAVKIANMSGRGFVGNGESCLIGGITILSDRQLLIRAIGPSLSGKGIVNVCNDPVLTIFDAFGEQIASNDNWNSAISGSTNTTAELKAAFSKTGAFSLPTGSNDAVILISLPAGSYTAVVTPKQSGSEGIGLLEFYDLEPSPDQGIYNLSLRGISGPGEDAIILGVITTGNGPTSYFLRAVGPGLSPYGVVNYLPDPVISFMTRTGTLLKENDNWYPSFSNYYFGLWGAFPLPDASKDAALVFEVGYSGFPPGASCLNTAVVSSSKDAAVQTGIALVEVYFVSRWF